MITIVPLGVALPNTDDICWWETGWVYTEGKIYLCDLKDWYIEFYKHHEIAHHIYEKYLTTQDKEKYLKLYQRDKKHGIKRFYREYGYNDMEENFCDEYALLKTNEKVNIYVKKRIKLILNILNS